MRGRSEWIRRCRSIKCSCQLPVSGGSAEALPCIFWGFMKIVRLAALGGTAEAAVPHKHRLLEHCVYSRYLLAAESYLLEPPACMLSLASPKSRAIFLPSKRRPSGNLLHCHSYGSQPRRRMQAFAVQLHARTLLRPRSCLAECSVRRWDRCLPTELCSPLASGGSIDGNRIGKLQTGFCCGKRARRQTSANPSTMLFETVANFMTAP